MIRDVQDRRHQEERDRDFGAECRPSSLSSGRGNGVIHGGMGNPRRENERRGRCAEQRAGKLAGDVERRVAAFDLTQSEKRDRRRWIDVRAGLFSPGWINDSDRGGADRQSHQESAEQRIGQRLTHRGGRVLQDRCERERADHEKAEARALN